MPTVPALLFAMTLGLAPGIRPVDVPMPPIVDFPAPAPPQIDATAWMVWSVEQDSELGSMEPDMAFPPASITKLMTAMLTVDRAALDNPVTISATAANTPIGYAGQPDLRQGEVWTVRQLLTFLLVQSGNDAAVALAEHVAGSLDAFVALMNDRAADLGMTNAHFVNPSGLDAEGHLTSARDLVVMGRAVLSYPDLLRIARIKHISFDIGGRQIDADATDRDLGVFPGLFGLKTGDTLSAGQTMLAYAATPRGSVLAVVLGTANRRVATEELIAWAETALGPKDYFFAPIAGTDLELSFPDWYAVRLLAARSLPIAQPAAPGPTPLTDSIDQGLRELLPSLLGGGTP